MTASTCATAGVPAKCGGVGAPPACLWPSSLWPAGGGDHRLHAWRLGAICAAATGRAVPGRREGRAGPLRPGFPARGGQASGRTGSRSITRRSTAPRRRLLTPAAARMDRAPAALDGSTWSRSSSASWRAIDPRGWPTSRDGSGASWRGSGAATTSRPRPAGSAPPPTHGSGCVIST